MNVDQIALCLDNCIAALRLAQERREAEQHEARYHRKPQVWTGDAEACRACLVGLGNDIAEGYAELFPPGSATKTNCGRAGKDRIRVRYRIEEITE